MIRRGITGRAIVMAVAWTLGVVAPASSQAPAGSPMLRLESYVKADGAITVFADGSYVEPYFAMRALSSAADLGFDVDSLARGYIAWQLRRFDADSSFKRYCLGSDSADRVWAACGAADADDSALGLWIELLYRTAGRKRMPAAWKHSADRSRRALAALRDSATSVYLVSQTVRIGLFMDNIEVLSALENSARTPAAAAAGDRVPLARGAARLRSAINRVFWDRPARSFRISSQPGAQPPRFYPEIVAQVFPAVFGYGNPVRSSQALTAQWLRDHERDWVAESDSAAAWGLVAVAAARTGHSAAANCWVERAGRMRAGAHWNVADEAIYRVLSTRNPAARCALNDGQRIR